MLSFSTLSASNFTVTEVAGCPIHSFSTLTDVLICLFVIVCIAPPDDVTCNVYSSRFNSYPIGAVFSFTLYVPDARAPEVTVPSVPVVNSNFVPSGRVTSKTALAKVIALSSASTLMSLILFARLPVPEPPEFAEI